MNFFYIYLFIKKLKNMKKYIYFIFCQVVQDWKLIPKNLRSRHTVFKYNHLRGKNPVGIGKMLEIIEDAGYKIELNKDVKPIELITENDVLSYILLHIGTFPLSFQLKYKNEINVLSKDLLSFEISPYKRFAIVTNAGYIRKYVKK